MFVQNLLDRATATCGGAALIGLLMLRMDAEEKGRGWGGQVAGFAA
jgi:hypothetical protein